MTRSLFHSQRWAKLPLPFCSPAAVRLSACAVILCCFVTSNDGLVAGQQNGTPQAYKLRIAPQWVHGDRWLWYQNRLPQGKREFVLVDTDEGIRRPAFDHAAVASALTDAGLQNISADRLPLESLVLFPDRAMAEFRCRGKLYRWSHAESRLSPIEERTAAESAAADTGLQAVPRRSMSSGDDTTISFVNRLGQSVEIYWLDLRGERVRYASLEAGQRRDQHTFAGHVWEAVQAGRVVGRYQAGASLTEAVIDGNHIAPFQERGGRRPRRTETEGGKLKSPDGNWSVTTVDGNLQLTRLSDDSVTMLTTGGSAAAAFGMPSWSPDSRRLVAFQITAGDDYEVHLVESSPENGGRAVLHSRRYPLPGDRFTSYELHLFDIEQAAEVPVDVEPFDFGRPRVRWHRDDGSFAVEKIDRGHQRFRVIRVDSETGSSRNLIDETSETFIWTAHTQRNGLRKVSWLSQTDEFIFMSEKSGWRHLTLHNGSDGSLIHHITSGEWVVRGVDRIDEERRQIWFQASGMDADQDPYLVHYCRVNFDGTELTRLTRGNGNHTLQYSPDGGFYVDTWSRVDMPPVHELRRAGDGSLVCELERADISELTAAGWQSPEVFSATGRDGQTEIWGIIERPDDFDPNRRYPVIEDIYAGPHDSFVPKSFRPGSRFSSLTRLGFIVVKIDGMGTANRSKKFHDVCWHNLKDAGFPDRIAWMRAAAERYPSMDLSRVGVYGTSAGGQSAAGALLFHPDFYKAAYASCGCHDNRMDKASWNEQWMGYPVGPQYAESSNVDNAHRLQGKLMLVVGEMDTNVPPESTLRFVDALIEADKDFDLIVIPGMGHSNGGRYGQRRMREFFVRHLQPDAVVAISEKNTDARD
jgi:dipeptidyl-peptidase-4